MAEELKAETSQVLKRNCPPSKLHISQEETTAIRELKKHNSKFIFTAEKGLTMVVKDRQDYSNKAHQLLADTNTDNPLHKDPTNKLKNKLAQTLRDITSQGGLSDAKYKRLYPTSTVP